MVNDMDFDEILYVGAGSKVVAVERQSGRVIWKRALARGAFSLDRFVNVVFDSGSIFAQTGRILYCLDAETGQIQWKNNLRGCGYGIASLATANSSAGNVEAVNHRKSRAAKLVLALIWVNPLIVLINLFAY